MRFEISPEDQIKIDEWLEKVVYPPIIEQQLQDPQLRQTLEIFGVKDENGKFKYPYTGAIGGGLTYEFSPTGLGMVIKVKYFNGAELDLTDYDAW